MEVASFAVQALEKRSLEKARQELELELRSIADKVSGDSFDICQHSIPFPLPTTYVRPATTADQLHDMLAAFAGPQQQQHQPPPTVFQLLGMPGIGKSTLALIAAKELEDQGTFDGSVYYLRAPPCLLVMQMEISEATSRAAASMQLALLKQLGHLNRVTDSEAASPDTLFFTLHHLFSSTLHGRKHLLVLDDVWDHSIVSRLRCTSMGGAVLVTACQPVVDTEAEHTLMVQPNAFQSAAGELMSKLLGRSVAGLSPAQQDLVRRVLGSCDGNLLAVTVLGRALKQREQLCGWQQVCDDFMAKLSDPNDNGIPLDYRRKETVDVSPCLNELVDASLLYKVHKAATAAGCAAEGPPPAYFAHALVAEYLRNRLPVQLSQGSYQRPKMPKIIGDSEAAAAAAAAAIGTAAADNRRHLALLLLGYGQTPAVQWAEQKLGVTPSNGRHV
ncbi:hypothetical protein OEZ85_007433 [Tetradesmus obliquus]|uniref:NB-ARC domain-containing protein n=1 Tax=Tetradesmus obliquus TaxID=3088 RepID=A0ABY8TFW6_TETOB|nr:hypothetical protein OEZ85_007433 [Tetradesmus obliquus]